MDIKISLEIGLSPALESFLGKILGGQDQPTERPSPGGMRGSTREHTQHLAAEAVSKHTQDIAVEVALAAEQEVVDDSPQDEAPRRTRRTKAQIAADETAKSSGNQEADPTDAGSEESLADALGIEEGGDDGEQTYTTADVRAAVQEAVDRNGNVKLIQQTMFEASGKKAIGSDFPLDKAGATIEALAKLPKV